MDKSKEFIKMCDCLEIQGLRPKDGLEGEFICLRDSDEEGYQAGEWQPIADCKYVWLPRQDQLQEMIGDKDCLTLLSRFHYSCIPIRHFKATAKWVELDGELDMVHDSIPLNEVECTYPKQFTSMEQLWLAFVMKEKYNKTWTGEEWLSNLPHGSK